MKCTILLATTSLLVLTATALFHSRAERGTIAYSKAYAAEDGVASVEDYMIAVNARGGILDDLRETFGGKGPKSDKTWKVAKAKAAVVHALTEAVLARGSPNKGSDESWKKMVNGFGERTKALAIATANKDDVAAREQLEVLSKSCEGCHRVHK